MKLEAKPQGRKAERITLVVWKKSVACQGRGWLRASRSKDALIWFRPS